MCCNQGIRRLDSFVTVVLMLPFAGGLQQINQSALSCLTMAYTRSEVKHNALPIPNGVCRGPALSSEVDQKVDVQDVLAEKDNRLLARAYISHHTLKSLQGSISASLVTPELKQANSSLA